VIEKMVKYVHRERYASVNEVITILSHLQEDTRLLTEIKRSEQESKLTSLRNSTSNETSNKKTIFRKVEKEERSSASRETEVRQPPISSVSQPSAIKGQPLFQPNQEIEWNKSLKFLAIVSGALLCIAYLSNKLQNTQSVSTSSGTPSSSPAIVEEIAIPNPTEFGHGCGTGCSVKASMTKIANLEDGITKGTFTIEQKGGGRGDNPNAIERGTSILYVRCSEALYSRDKLKWDKIDLSDSGRYTTVQGGFGYYYDAVCKSEYIQSTPISSCQAAIDNAQRQIKSLKYYSKNAINPEYIEFPPDRPLKVGFVVQQNLGNNFDYRSENAIQITRDILGKCQDVGIVDFGAYQTDDIVSYGIVNGQVKQFECLSADLKKERNAKTPWGYINCDLGF
jgi:hypothetical protein